MILVNILVSVLLSLTRHVSFLSGIIVVVWCIFLLFLTAFLIRNIFLLLDSKMIQMSFSFRTLGTLLLAMASFIMYFLVALLPIILATVLIVFAKVLFLFYAPGIPPGYPILFYIALGGIGVFYSIFIFLRTSFAPLAVIDKRINIFRAFLASWALTGKKAGELFFLWYLIFLVNIAGFFVLFGVGLLFTIPLSFIMLAATYRELCS